MDPRTFQTPAETAVPRATITLVFHNQQHLVEDALGSLLRQEGVSCRIQVIDDGSVDRTWDRISDVLDSAASHGHEVRTSRFVEQLGPRRLINAVSSIDTECAIIARPEDQSRPDRAERLIHALDSTGASVVVSDRTRAGGSVLEHLADSRRQGSGMLSPREVAFQVASLPTSLGAMALRPNVIHSFPELSNARQPEELGAMLSFRGSLLGGCFYLDETLVDYKRSMGSLVVDYRSRETCRESLFADLLATRVAMLQDLRSLPRLDEDHDSSRIRLEASLKGALVELAERWTQAREDLWVNDLRPAWLSSDELESIVAEPVEAKHGSFMQRFRARSIGSWFGRKAA